MSLLRAGITSQMKAVTLTPSRMLSHMGNLHPPKDSQVNQKRLGRGPGSGHGKTSGRGQKGQKARGSVPNWFEGGQTPIYKIYPKRGFFRYQQLDLAEVSLAKIQQFVDSGRLQLEDGETLTMKKMKECGLISGTMKDGVAVLGTGAHNYKLNISIEASKASKTAVQAIEAVGGKFVSQFYSRYLGYRVHHSPEWFVRNRGYLPLQAKPIARKDIQFYSDPDRNGYLHDSDYVKQIKFGRVKGTTTSVNSQLKEELTKLEGTPSQGTRGFEQSGVVNFQDL